MLVFPGTAVAPLPPLTRRPTLQQRIKAQHPLVGDVQAEPDPGEEVAVAPRDEAQATRAADEVAP
ncbi:hypothetical protein [Streptomyces sp. UNOC14_S4]|uniref:hypothetical protein n=1 Tax=Streptomyces sp. UNOC14_S4 TaxID=2872340 RepID=UPI001E37F524|nr:hypothetical protein [Streptomyces sp. UNOC14_S4]MCC3768172.1 hypothetical protein [Streptomyces sp. UNOC14_S4]